ncbi:MAG: DUF2169 domain-containing protein [Planctomycetes bacterium]|nr:DUF2169 domain-containing protein [Planctomycetota bacterium]
MELTNATGLAADIAMGLRPDGRELLVVAVKGTFPIGKTAPEPVPILAADEAAGLPGLSPPAAESDLAPVKAKCDVLLNGRAYAAQPSERVTVALRVGALAKSFDVVGPRVWTDQGPSPAQPFTTMPISYAVAFGGPQYAENPVGVGFHDPKEAKDKPLPNTEEPGKPVAKPDERYRPMAFGPLGRSWQPRAKLAGTYDKNWIENVAPFLPADFDDRFYQCAPEDQQTDFLRGGETVELENLAPQGKLSFAIPKIDVPVVFMLKSGEHEETCAVCDTLLIEPDLGRFTLAWRASRPLRRNVFEVAQVVVGRKSRGWLRAMRCGKRYAATLREVR